MCYSIHASDPSCGHNLFCIFIQVFHHCFINADPKILIDFLIDYQPVVVFYGLNCFLAALWRPFPCLQDGPSLPSSQPSLNEWRRRNNGEHKEIGKLMNSITIDIE
jgi:hypothetical protein